MSPNLRNFFIPAPFFNREEGTRLGIEQPDNAAYTLLLLNRDIVRVVSYAYSKPIYLNP